MIAITKETSSIEPYSMISDIFTPRDSSTNPSCSQPPDLEQALLTSNWILEKVQQSDVYAQNLYSALCQNDFYPTDVFDLLRGRIWGCSWRHAGAIVASIKNHGDYTDWYCSGMSFDGEVDIVAGRVSEGIVTDEIKLDLARLGWKITS